MTKKPTYEELDQRVKELEKYAAEHKRVGEITQEERHLSKILLDNIPSVALLIKPETREIVYSNKHAAKIGAVSGEKCFVTWGKSNVPCPWCLAPELWATGQTKRIEVVVSDTVWDTYWVPITKDLYLHYAFDITERKKVEEKMRLINESTAGEIGEDFLRSITKQLAMSLGTRYALVGEVVTSEVNRIRTIAVWADGDYADNIEYSLTGTPCAKAIKQDYCIYSENVQQYFPDDHLLTEMGVESYVGIKLNNSSGDTVGILASLHDKPLEDILFIKPILTTFALRAAAEIERKQAEEKLRKQQYFLSKAQEMGKIGTWELDIKKNTLVWTDENYRIFGLPIGTELTYETFLNCVHPDDRKYVDKKWKAAFDKKPYDIEHRLLMNDGTIKWVREKAVLEFDEQGNCLRGTGFTQDITGRKKAEEEIKARQKEIEEINANLEKRVQEELQKSRQKDFIMIQRSRLAAMGEMMQYIIHQWGQPLNALNILFYNLEIMLDEIDLGTKEKEVDETIANGLRLVKEMFSTVDDFRNFFKPHKEKIEFSVNKNIKDILALFGDNFRYSKISVTLNEIEELKVRGFPNEFSQVILNILKNAKDAILAKGIKGKINIDILSEDDSVLIRIKDNGGGIPNNILDKVFDTYFTTKSERDGTGIGLYMSKIIIEEHMEGRISVKNVAGGAELEIALPRLYYTNMQSIDDNAL